MHANIASFSLKCWRASVSDSCQRFYGGTQAHYSRALFSGSDDGPIGIVGLPVRVLNEPYDNANLVTNLKILVDFPS